METVKCDTSMSAVNDKPLPWSLQPFPDEKVIALLQAKRDDLTTWPEGMRQDMYHDPAQPLWESCVVGSLDELRKILLTEAITRRCNPQLTLIMGYLYALYARVPKGGLDWHMVQCLEIEISRLQGDIEKACLDLVPGLNEVLPMSDFEHFLTAIERDVVEDGTE
jgi:hypothetical protein